MADQIVEEKILFRFSKLITDSAVPLDTNSPTTIGAAYYLRYSAADQLVNDPDVTVSLTFISKNNLLNANNI